MKKKITKGAKKAKVHGEGFSSAAKALKWAQESARRGRPSAIYELLPIRDLPVAKQAAAAVKGGATRRDQFSCWVAVTGP